MLRKPRADEGAGVHALSEACPPLDVNSVYNYLLLCEHFAETCVVGEKAGEVVAFTSGYLRPAHPNVLFIWQVAVGDAARGRGIAKKLLKEILARDACRSVDTLETTVTPSNNPSRALFHSLARDLDAPVEETVLFPGKLFGAEEHEDENLIRIGPFANHSKGV